MPTYQYICEKCDHEFELFQSMAAEPLTSCPKDQCAKTKWGRGRVRRVLSGGAGLIFKGDGFYSTDYRSESYKAGQKQATEAAKPKSDSSAKSNKGSDSGKGGQASKSD